MSGVWATVPLACGALRPLPGLGEKLRSSEGTKTSAGGRAEVPRGKRERSRQFTATPWSLRSQVPPGETRQLCKHPGAAADHLALRTAPTLGLRTGAGEEPVPPAACSQLRANLYIYLTFSKGNEERSIGNEYWKLLACPHIAQMGLGGQTEAEVGQGPEGRWVSTHTLTSHLCLSCSAKPWR